VTSEPNIAGRGVPPETTLAVLLRLVQWHLDDVAHDLPAGRVTAEQWAELATVLEDLTQIACQRAGRNARVTQPLAGGHGIVVDSNASEVAGAIGRETGAW
jgi:hypothetical protein